MRPTAFRRLVAAALVTAATLASLVSTPAQAPALVAPAALEKLLPAPQGWTRTRTNQTRIELSPTAAYSYADAVYNNGPMKMRVTLADTASTPDCLSALATLVTSFPAGHVSQIPPATTIRRLTLTDGPAALRWDNAAKEGEFIVVIGNRFVAKAEGSSLETSDILQTTVEQIDLKAVAALR